MYPEKLHLRRKMAAAHCLTIDGPAYPRRATDNQSVSYRTSRRLDILIHGRSGQDPRVAFWDTQCLTNAAKNSAHGSLGLGISRGGKGEVVLV